MSETNRPTPVLEDLRVKAEEEPRLIMTPAEAMRAREAREARTRRR